jgi:cyclomaltodextrinase / maltogenic alpha-amylase / neopullulanase
MTLLVRISAIILALSSDLTLAESLTFDTSGGDAWLFEMPASGNTGSSRCDRILIQSPSGQARATRIEDRFYASVRLVPGENSFEAVCFRSSKEIARSEPQQWNLRLHDAPKAWIRTIVSDEGIRLNAGRTQRARALPAAVARFDWFTHPSNPAPVETMQHRRLETQTAVSGEEIQLRAPLVNGEYQIRLRVTDSLGRTDESRSMFRVLNGRAEAVQIESEHPAWVDRSIVYGAAPYVFDPQEFEGLRERLDEIAALGATVLWLSPVTDAPDDDFGYAVTDHFYVRRRFGSMRQFRELVREAHGLGLKVIIDFIPNHLSEQHLYFEYASEQQRRSSYYDWFDRDENDQVTQYFDWSHLKNLNYDQPAVQNYIIEAFSHFVRHLEVDGFRVDASWAVAQRAPEFWPRLRAELKRINPDILLLAEASARDPYNFGHGFDAAYDWSDKLGEWAWHDVFDEGQANLDRLRAALTNEGRGFPSDALILRFLNNNDTGERFATMHGLPTAKLAATLLFTLPGIPLIYNGDEMGADFLPYDEGPPIRWDDHHPLRKHYQELASLRKKHTALYLGDLRLLKTKQDQALLAFTRKADRSELLVLMNFSDQNMRVDAADEPTADALRRFNNALELLSERNVNTASLTLPPKSAIVLERSLPAADPASPH